VNKSCFPSDPARGSTPQAAPGVARRDWIKRNRARLTRVRSKTTDEMLREPHKPTPLPPSYDWRASFDRHASTKQDYWMPTYRTPNYDAQWSGEGPLSARRVRPDVLDRNALDRNALDAMDASPRVVGPHGARSAPDGRLREALGRAGHALLRGSGGAPMLGSTRLRQDLSWEERGEAVRRRGAYSARIERPGGAQARLAEQRRTLRRMSPRQRERHLARRTERNAKGARALRESEDWASFERADEARFRQDTALAALRQQIAEVSREVGTIRERERQEGKEDRLRRRKAARARAQRMRYSFDRKERMLRRVLTKLEADDARAAAASAARVALTCAELVSEMTTDVALRDLREHAKDVRKATETGGLDGGGRTGAAFSVYSPQVERLFQRIVHGRQWMAFLTWRTYLVRKQEADALREAQRLEREAREARDREEQELFESLKA
jgi:hypothetical protein